MLETISKRVLLVEDEAILGIATKRKLEKFGYQVTHAMNGLKALELIETDRGITLILMDIDLGQGSNGIELSKRILEIADIPIVFVSSHTEPDIVSLTEQVTSYGYIVKSSDMVVYDASMKMAYKLFRERSKSETFSNYIETALEGTTEPLFICDGAGDIVFFNRAYLRVQGLEDPAMVETRFEAYSKQITVFSEDGRLLEKDDWASTRGLRGLSGEGVVFYVFNHAIERILVNRYAYAPVYDKRGALIGTYVKIGSEPVRADPATLRLIEGQLQR